MTSMPVRPDRAPLPLTADLAALSRVDGCPDCLNYEPARAWTPLEVGYRTSHLCSDCGRAWTTDWRD